MARLAALRAARSSLLEAVAAGSTRPAEVLRRPDEVGRGIRVLTLVEAVPGASKVASRRLLAQLGIPELATVAESDHRAAALAAALDGVESEAVR